MNDIIMECAHVRKSFSNGAGSNEVLKGIHLKIRRNEFVVVFGPGQCGKTTLLNILSGLDSPSSGMVSHNGVAVDGPRPDRGMVYQTTALFPWLTVMGNVEFGPKMRGEGKKERRARAQKYIDLVGLKGFEKHFPVKLSGGMKQRVGIARAYCNDPDIIFMDEPFGHLDAQTRYLMEEEIVRIYSAEKRTVVFVTNNIEEAVYLADRVLLMSESPSEIMKEYVIELPRPRSYISQEFLDVRQMIASESEHLREATKR